jgi:hypothetical protein
MSRFLQKSKTLFTSSRVSHDEQYTTRQDDALRYNNDLLPSPPGQYKTANNCPTLTDQGQPTEDGNGNIISHTILL